jgi:hypothetical protein
MPGQKTSAVGKLLTDRFNRQLHPDEKTAIVHKANGDKAEEDKLTKAACYVVKCWAEFKPGSTDYNANYVGEVEASQLGKELEWVSRQKEAGLFDYTPRQKIADTIKGTGMPVIKDGLKVATGTMAVAGGITACSSLAGCALGGPAAVFGAGEAIEGATGLYGFMTGEGPGSYNPVRNMLNDNLPAQWGNTAYDIGSLGSTLLSLGVRLPYNIGVTEGIDRTKSMFGVTVSKWNNPKLNPYTKQQLPSYVGQGILTYGIGSKGGTVINDIREPRK